MTDDAIVETTLVVGPETVTVNGYVPRKNDAAWLGLDLYRAEIREQASIMVFLYGDEAPPDHHLRVPWMHPDDLPTLGDDPDCWAYYRVRPRWGAGRKFMDHKVKDAKFERREDGAWLIRMTF